MMTRIFLLVALLATCTGQAQTRNAIVNPATGGLVYPDVATFRAGNNVQAGAWVTGLAYVTGDVAKGSDGNIYRAIASTTGNNPTTDAGTHWQLEDVQASVTLNVPSRFTTFATAWAFLRKASIASDVFATIQFADGTYAMGSSRFLLNHPYGARIKITGNTTTLGNVVLSWASSTYTVPAGYASENHGYVTVSHGNTSPLIDGFKVIGPGNANMSYGFFAWNNSRLNFGPKMWVTGFYSAVATFWSSSAFCDYMRVSNGGDGNLFAYGSSTISFQGGLSEGANTYFAQSGACIEFSSFLFAPGATFQNNLGRQVLLDFSSSAMFDGATFTSAGAFDSAPAIDSGGTWSYQCNTATYNNCSSNRYNLRMSAKYRTDVSMFRMGLEDPYEGFYGTWALVGDWPATCLTITKANVATMFLGYPGSTGVIGADNNNGLQFRAGVSKALSDGTLALSFSSTAVATALPTTIGNGGTAMAKLKHGTATLVSGTVTITDTSTTANREVQVTRFTDGGSPGLSTGYSVTRSAGASFTITAKVSAGTTNTADTSVVSYLVIEP